MKKIVFRQKMLQDLIEGINAELVKDPENKQYLVMRGLILNLSQQYREAIDEFIKVIKIAPKDTAAYFLKSDSHFNMQDYDLAKHDYLIATLLQADSDFSEKAVEAISTFPDADELRDIGKVLEFEKHQLFLSYFSGVDE